MVDDHLVQHVCIFHSPAHEVCAFYIMAIIRESGCAFGCHVSHLRELLSFQIFGKSTDDADLDDTAFIDASQHIPEDCVMPPAAAACVPV